MTTCWQILAVVDGCWQLLHFRFLDNNLISFKRGSIHDIFKLPPKRYKITIGIGVTAGGRRLYMGLLAVYNHSGVPGRVGSSAGRTPLLSRLSAGCLFNTLVMCKLHDQLLFSV